MHQLRLPAVPGAPLETEIAAAGLAGSVQVRLTGCMGNCDAGPAMLVEPDGVFYCRLKPRTSRTLSRVIS
jgi:NADH:ubiquinone oxidoreductase subunit E